MSYYKSWSKTISENQYLKAVSMILGISVAVLGVTLMTYVTKDPLLIERACYASTVETLKDQKRSEEEIRSFLSEAAYQRFDSNNDDESFLSQKEIKSKSLELKELSQKELSQKILVKDIQVKDGFAFIVADRVLSSKKLKAALDLKIKASFITTQRTASNPSGLILSMTEPILEKESK